MIWKLFLWIFGNFCRHKWITIRESETDYEHGCGRPTGEKKITYVLRCEKCGEVNVTDINIWT